MPWVDGRRICPRFVHRSCADGRRRVVVMPGVFVLMGYVMGVVVELQVLLGVLL